MIHDDLRHMFERTPPPSLSTEFSMNLRRRLRAEGPVQRRPRRMPTWTARLYWVVVAVLLGRYWHPVVLTPLQIMLLAMVGATVILTPQARDAARVAGKKDRASSGSERGSGVRPGPLS